MKRLISLLCILLLVPSFCFADWYDAPLFDTAVLCPVQIPDKSVCVNPGKYTIGEDIPAGIYQIDTDCYGCDIMVKSEKNSIMFSNYIGKNYWCTRIRLPLYDGYTIIIEKNPVYFSKAEPVDLTNVLPGTYFIGEDIPAGSYYFQSVSLIESSVFVKPSGGYHSISSEKTKIDLPDGSYIHVYGGCLFISEYKNFFDWSILE